MYWKFHCGEGHEQNLALQGSKICQAITLAVPALAVVLIVSESPELLQRRFQGWSCPSPVPPRAWKFHWGEGLG